MSDQKRAEALSIISSSIRQFSAELYKFLAQEDEGNIICSPVSVSIILGIITFGARDKTEKELRASLCLPPDHAMAKFGIESLVDSLSNFQKVKLSLASKLFIQKGFEIKSEFRVVTKTSLHSELESVDFSDPEGSSEIINSWCEEKTNGRIKDLVQPDTLEDATIILVNTIYFKGNWAHPFITDSTTPQPFKISQTVTKTVQMMFMNDDFNYGNISNISAQYIELPYEKKDGSDAISLYIILPNEIEGLQKVEENLDKIDFSKLQRSERRVMLHLPKFKVERKLELQTVLRKMGINDAFENNANFSGIANGQLKVTKVFQKSFIAVNEQGTEAGVVSYSEMFHLCRPPSFTVDKPFLCVLVAKITGTPIFIGRVVDPTIDS